MFLKEGASVPLSSSQPQSRFRERLEGMYCHAKAVGAHRNLLILFGLFVFARTIASLWLPFGWDHGMMAEVGHTYFKGGLPYRDAWDMKGPFAYLMFAAAEAIFGRNMWGIRVIDAAIMVSTAAVLGRAASRLSSPNYAPWIALGFLLLFSSNGWFFTAQPDGWVAAVSTFAITPYLNTNQYPTLFQSWRSGLMVGLAALIKPLYVVFVLCPAAAVALQNKRPVERLRHWLMLASGLIVPIVIVILLYVDHKALGSLIEVHILYPAKSYSYVGQHTFGTIVSSLASHLRSQPMLEQLPVVTLAGIIPFITVGIWNLRKSPIILATLTLWACIALFCIILQGKFYAYHWYPLYPPAIILAVTGLATVNIAANQLSTIAPLLYLSALSIPLLIVPVTETFWTARHIFGLTTETKYYSNFQFREYNANDQVEAVMYLSAQADLGDRLFVLGHEPIINYLSGLEPPTRFIFSLPLFEPGPFLHQYRLETLDQLEKTKPRYVIVGTPFAESKSATIDDFPEFGALLGARYRYAKSFGYLDLYEHRPEADTSSVLRPRL
jgi:hypothetical protein